MLGAVLVLGLCSENLLWKECDLEHLEASLLQRKGNEVWVLRLCSESLLGMERDLALVGERVQSQAVPCDDQIL